jgi:hypothetical protein
LKKRDLWDDPKQDVSARYWKTSRREENAGKKSKGCVVGRQKRVVPPTKNRTMLQKAKQTAILSVKHNNIYCIIYLSRWHYLK